jgi:hypothetical protein
MERSRQKEWSAGSSGRGLEGWGHGSGVVAWNKRYFLSPWKHRLQIGQTVNTALFRNCPLVIPRPLETEPSAERPAREAQRG